MALTAWAPVSFGPSAPFRNHSVLELARTHISQVRFFQNSTKLFSGHLFTTEWPLAPLWMAVFLHVFSLADAEFCFFLFRLLVLLAVQSGC